MKRSQGSPAVGAILTDASEIRFDDLTLDRYAVEGVRPSAVVWPRSEEELGRWLREVHRHRAKVLTWGAGELMHLGGAPEGHDLAICTTRLNKVLDFDPENLTISVQAGTTLAQLQKLALTSNLRLPLDPPVSSKATLGGIVAANAFGPLRHLYGGVRDFLLGCAAVLADGTFVKFGGKTVKNVAGYDLSKLFIGSCGTLGVLTRLTFRLLPVAETCRTVLAAFSSREACCAAAAEMAASALGAAAVEVISPAALGRIALPGSPVQADAYVLAVRFEGKRQVVAAVTASAERALRAKAEEVRRLNAAPGRQFWGKLGEVLNGRAGNLQIRVNAPMAEVAQALARIEQMVQEHDCTPELVSHFGLGVIILNVEVGQPDSEVALARGVTTLRRQLAPQGGSVVLSRANPWSKAKVEVWGALPDTLNMVRRIKNQFDPQGVFAGGRFVGGL